MYTPRLTIPERGNPYYNTRSNGGYSNAIVGKPTEQGLNVLRNCVGYAYGRFNEIGNYGYMKYLKPVNAEQFIIAVEKYHQDLEIGMTPKLGSCMVWSQGSTGTGNDGAGHVAIVEQINADGTIVTSESGYNAKRAFWTQTRNNNDGRWQQGNKYNFLGFIYNPAVADLPEPTYYIVKKGDTLTKISKMFGVAVGKIAVANNITNVNLIRVGQRLIIPR